MNAGVTVLGEINPATDTVMNFFWLGGSFTFAVLLGVVTDDITVFVDVSSPMSLSCSLSHQKPSQSHVSEHPRGVVPMPQADVLRTGGFQ